MNVFVVKEEKLTIKKKKCRVGILKQKAHGQQKLCPDFSLHFSTAE